MTSSHLQKKGILSSMRNVQIDYTLFYDLVGYFAAIPDPTPQEEHLYARLAEKGEKLVRHQEYTQKLQQQKTMQ